MKLTGRREAKLRAFAGKEPDTITTPGVIIPKKSQHVNVHKFCMHLFSGAGERGLPNLKKILVESAL